MDEEIILSMRKLPNNTLFDLIVGHTKTKKLSVPILKIKRNALVLQNHVIQFFT